MILSVIYKQYRMDSKTLSTNNSRPNFHTPSFHPYHRYQTLLNYMTTFIADIRLNIVNLKQAIYDLVGVQIQASLGNNSHPSCQCETCEVEYLMKGCRTLRQDITKATALLRGLSQGKVFKDYLTALTERMCGKNKSSTPEGSTEMPRTIKLETEINDKFKAQKDALLNHQYQLTNQIGFLTFRQISKLSQYSDGKEQKNSIVFNENQQQYCRRWGQKQENQDKNSDSTQVDDYLDRALQLVYLIRGQFRSQQNQQGTKELKIDSNESNSQRQVTENE